MAVHRRGIPREADAPTAITSRREARAAAAAASGSAEVHPTLWSLPPDTPAPPSTAEDTLLAAWMGALTQDGRDGPPQPGGAAPNLVRGPDSLGLPLGPASLPPPSRPPHPPPSDTGRSAWLDRSTLSTILPALTVSALIGLALVPALTELADRTGSGARTADATGPATVDDRVVVPGPSADCVTMLVKPRPDGTTVKASGTCFAVG